MTTTPSFADEVFQCLTDTSEYLQELLSETPTIIDHRKYQRHYKSQPNKPVGSIETSHFTLTFYMSLNYQGMTSSVHFANQRHNQFLPPPTADTRDRAFNIATLALQILYI